MAIIRLLVKFLAVSQEALKDGINCLGNFSVFYYLVLNFQAQKPRCFIISQGWTEIDKLRRKIDEARMPMHLLMVKNKPFSGSEHLHLPISVFFISSEAILQNYNKNSLYQFAKINHSYWDQNFLTVVYYHPED